MSESPRILDIFIKRANDASLNLLLIGGFAASYWGQPRFTGDLDFVVSIENFELAKKVLDSIYYS